MSVSVCWSVSTWLSVFVLIVVSVVALVCFHGIPTISFVSSAISGPALAHSSAPLVLKKIQCQTSTGSFWSKLVSGIFASLE